MSKTVKVFDATCSIADDIATKNDIANFLEIPKNVDL